MEPARFNYRSFFDRALNENEIKQLFEGYKTDPVLAVLLREAHIDVCPFPVYRREVLEMLVINQFEEMMHWYAPLVKPVVSVKYGESYLTDRQVRTLFDTNNTYLNLRIIFADCAAGQQFVVHAQESGFIEPVSMMDYFTQRAGLVKVVGPDLKPAVNSSLYQHCVVSKSTYISLRDCDLQHVPPFAHAGIVQHLNLEWNSLQAADLAAYAQLKYLDLSHNKLTVVPVNLPDSLKRLYLSGNPIQKLEFKRLPSMLKELDISYMEKMDIPEDFWKLLAGRVMTVKISFNMKLMPPDNYDLSGIEYVDQFGKEGIIEDGTVVFVLQEESSTDVTPTHSDQNSDMEDEEAEIAGR